MMDFILLEDGQVQLRFETEEGGFHRSVRAPGDDVSDLPADVCEVVESHWTPELIAAWLAIRAAESTEVPAVVRRMVPKSLVQSRLIAAGLMDDAHAALMASPVLFARWFAPDQPNVYADDPDAVAFLVALGADVEAVMAE